MMQLEDAILRSATYSAIHLACIVCLVFLLVKTWLRLVEKRRKNPSSIGIGSTISIMFQYEVTILVGLVFTNLSSNLLLYIRLGLTADPSFSDPAALSACESLNMAFQVVLPVFTWQLALFSDKVLLFKGKWFLRACTAAMAAIVAIVAIGSVAGFAWAGFDPTSGKREPSPLVMAMNGVYIVLVVVPAIVGSFRAMQRAPGRVERYGMRFIMSFFVLILLVVVFQALYTLLGEYTFSFASWLSIPAGIYLAYLGLILPPWIRKRLKAGE